MLWLFTRITPSSVHASTRHSHMPASHRGFKAQTLSFLVEIVLMQEYSRITSEGPEKLAAFKTLIMRYVDNWLLRHYFEEVAFL